MIDEADPDSKPAVGPIGPEAIPVAAPVAPAPPELFMPPTPGESITSELTRNTYTMGEKIGEGSFGEVYACVDAWGNDLAAKVLKPLKKYEEVKAAALGEFQKLLLLRHPNITYIYDAFEYRTTFYIITERCYGSIEDLLTQDWLQGQYWLMPIARYLLQAVHFVHINQIVHQDIHAGNVFTSFAKDEMDVPVPDGRRALQFRLGDLGVAKLFHEIDGTNTRAKWMLPPEVIDTQEFGPLDYRIDIYHAGLLLLEIASSKRLQFTTDEIRNGKPREMALTLPVPWNFALEKALRRHVAFRTDSPMELWRDLNSPATPDESGAKQTEWQSGPASDQTPVTDGGSA